MNDASDNASKLFFISSDNSFQDFAARYEKLLLRKFVFGFVNESFVLLLLKL